MPGGRPRQPITLTDEEREYLESLVRKKTTAQQIVFRSRIILLAGEGLKYEEIAERLKTTHQTIGHWYRRFIKFRLNGLVDAPRSGTPRSIGDKKVAEIITLTLETRPQGQTHWSTRHLAEKVGLSHSSIGRIWRAFGLKPHCSESFQLSADPEFVEKVRDIVGLYLNPPDGALVLSVDEKPQIQAIERTQPIIPMKPGQVEQHTSEYIRHGTTNLFAAFDVASGTATGKCYQRKRSAEFTDFLDHVAAVVDPTLEVHVILDNSSIHKSPPVKIWLLQHPQYHLHFTPTHSSWLNQVEVWFSLLQCHQLKRGAYCSVGDLEAAILGYIESTNNTPKPFKWTKTADQIIERVSHFCQQTLNGHS